MSLAALLVIAGCVLVAGLTSKRLESLPVTAPMLAVTLGILVGRDGFDLVAIELGGETVVLLAEATLALLLFSDASKIDHVMVRRFAQLPARLLLIALPMTIIGGAFVTSLLLTDLTWQEAALVAAMVAPTDAALGQAVVMNPRVPHRIRETLDIESGLNDGLVVPVFATLVLLVEGHEIDGPSTLVGTALGGIAIGALVGSVVGWVGGRLCTQSRSRGGATDGSIRLATIAVLAVVFATAVQLGGNGLIAAFVGGLAYRAGAGASAPQSAELTEDLGQLGAQAAFVIFGAMLVGPSLGVITVPVVICAVASLTVGRMVPTAIALIGTRLRAVTVAFIGWFGPRGLASVLFGLLLVTEADMDEGSELFAIVTLVVLGSVYLHGITAAPLARRYGEWHATHPERDEMSESLPAQAGG